jgi:Ca2+-binding EF-hand superfamily protein
MAISGIGSSTPTTQRPDPAKAASDLFAKIDTKDQGYIDKTELQTAFDQISGDGKGSASDVDNFLSQVDTDKDGKISKQELTDGFQKVSDQLNAQFDASRVGPPPGGAQPPSVDDIFSNLDTKNQGYLDKDELWPRSIKIPPTPPAIRRRSIRFSSRSIPMATTRSPRTN